ncbi:MAG: hypothetical protein DCC52_08080 [Chloroflexi bacterium]|nr:MAG: hypothetical protein DCC52_08080 [Chloroflexota bacterium]
MKRIDAIVGIAFLSFAFLLLNYPHALAQGNLPGSCDQEKVVGCVLTVLDKVPIRYNDTDAGALHGENPDGTGYMWQCVELIRRYYHVVYGYPVNWADPSGFISENFFHAYEIFDDSHHPKRMSKFQNGSSTRPQKGDILVFRPWGTNPDGHVAIVKSVEPGKITFVQQNYSDLGEDSLPINSNNWIDSQKRYGDVRGWLRDGQSSTSTAPTPAPSGNLSWLKNSYSINNSSSWWYTFGFCNDNRSIKLFLDGNLVLEKDEKVMNSSATVPWWKGDHTVRIEILDSTKGTFPDLKIVAWPDSIDCKGQVLGALAATKPTIAPISTVASIPTVALPFTVIASGSSALGTPSLVSPPNGSLISHTTSISLIWKPVVGASSYRVEFLGDQKPTSLSCGVNVNVICSFKDVRPGTLYWHVKAIGANSKESDWSDTWSFTIRQSLQNVPLSLSAPELAAPGKGSSRPKSTDIFLRWDSVLGADEYRVELWGGPYSAMTPCDWQSGTSCHIGQMWPGTMYDWSETWSFTIEEQAPPPTDVPVVIATPRLANPGNGSTLPQSTEINLQWKSSSNVIEYKVELWGGPYSAMTPCDWQSGTSCHIGQMWPGTM